jgi:hypothetical protein
MVLVNFRIQLAKSMKAAGKKIRSMERASFLSPMVNLLLLNLFLANKSKLMARMAKIRVKSVLVFFLVQHKYLPREVP